MEVITEGEVTVASIPEVRLGDVPLDDLVASNRGDLIEKEILALVKRIQTLRHELHEATQWIKDHKHVT